MKRGMTAEELAQRANVTRATVAKLESGKGNPTLETIFALGQVFQLTANELVKMAEAEKIETAKASFYDKNGIRGTCAGFPDFEIFHLKAGADVRALSEPHVHGNTAEVCMILSGKIRLTIMDKSHELGPGDAVRFKALQDHCLEILEESEFLLIHHNMS